jgi:hypothetical protein
VADGGHSGLTIPQGADSSRSPHGDVTKPRGYIDAGEAAGAKIVVDGRTFKMDRQGYENGY